MEKDIETNKYERLAHKYGISVEEAKSRSDNMVQVAKEAGLDFRFDTMIQTNTFDAHRLAMFAKTKDLMHEMTERLLYAYYTESKHIGDHETLEQLAEEVGLNRKEVADVLKNNGMANEVRSDEQEATELGINSIPFFLINRKYTITGAQSSETFLQALQQIMDQDGPFSKDNQ